MQSVQAATSPAEAAALALPVNAFREAFVTLRQHFEDALPAPVLPEKRGQGRLEQLQAVVHQVGAAIASDLYVIVQSLLPAASESAILGLVSPCNSLKAVFKTEDIRKHLTAVHNLPVAVDLLTAVQPEAQPPTPPSSVPVLSPPGPAFTSPPPSSVRPTQVPQSSTHFPSLDATERVPAATPIVAPAPATPELLLGPALAPTSATPGPASSTSPPAPEAPAMRPKIKLSFSTVKRKQPESPPVKQYIQLPKLQVLSSPGPTPRPRIGDDREPEALALRHSSPALPTLHLSTAAPLSAPSSPPQLSSPKSPYIILPRRDTAPAQPVDPTAKTLVHLTFPNRPGVKGVIYSHSEPVRQFTARLVSQYAKNLHPADCVLQDSTGEIFEGDLSLLSFESFRRKLATKEKVNLAVIVKQQASDVDETY